LEVVLEIPQLRLDLFSSLDVNNNVILVPQPYMWIFTHSQWARVGEMQETSMGVDWRRGRLQAGSVFRRQEPRSSVAILTAYVLGGVAGGEGCAACTGGPQWFLRRDATVRVRVRRRVERGRWQILSRPDSVCQKLSVASPHTTRLRASAGWTARLSQRFARALQPQDRHWPLPRTVTSGRISVVSTQPKLSHVGSQTSQRSLATDPCPCPRPDSGPSRSFPKLT